MNNLNFYTCACGCNKQIEIKPHHKYYGIPKYIKGHHKSRLKHGGTNTRLFGIWANIKTRCSNPNIPCYKDYGGRGITICNEWSNSFEEFRNWSLNNGYADNLEIDRINNDLGYNPENCRWEIHTENMRNRNFNKIKSLKQANEIRELDKTDKYTQKELAEMYNVHQTTISYIINNKIWKMGEITK